MKLRVIPTKVHGAVDMATGPVLIAAPTLLRMNGNKGATIPPRAVGAAAIVNALLTDYEFGLKRLLPMRTHLALDAVGGVTLAATPFLTRASKKGVRHWLPHAVLGANEVFLALTTKQRPPRAQRLRAWAPRGALSAAGVAALAGAAIVTKRKRDGQLTPGAPAKAGAPRLSTERPVTMAPTGALGNRERCSTQTGSGACSDHPEQIESSRFGSQVEADWRHGGSGRLERRVRGKKYEDRGVILAIGAEGGGAGGARFRPA